MAKEAGNMNKKHNRSIAIFFVMVAAFLLLFGGLALGEGSPNGVRNWSQWTGGVDFILLTVLPAAGLCVLLDWVLFVKKP
jgi:hypothetical protein